MILKLRKPERRHFKSSINIRRRRIREYYYASISVLVVKIVLFIFLLILFNVSYRAFSKKFTDVPPILRMAVPYIVLVFAAVLLFFIYRNIKQIRSMAKEKNKVL